MLLAMSAASLVSAAATIELPITVDEDYTAAKELLDEINKARVNTYNLHELQMDAQLQDIAMLRGAELAVAYAHYRPFDYPTMVQDEYRNIKLENAGMGQGSASVIYSNWASSAGHAPVMHDRNAYSCGIGSVVYENTRYWILVTSANQVSVPATTTGVKYGVSRSIKTESSRIKFYMWDGHFNLNGSEQTYTGSHVFYGTNSQIGVFISNLYDPSMSIGYRVPVSMLTYSTTTPGILSVSASGVVTPKSTGSGSVTVALKSNPDVNGTIPVEVRSNTTYQRPTITLIGTSFLYNGQPVKPGVTVTDCFGNKLTEGKDYTVEYFDNNKAGMGSVRATMIGNYHNPTNGNFDFYTAGFYIQANPSVTEPTPSNPSTGGGTVSNGNMGDDNGSFGVTTAAKDSMTMKLSKTVYTYTGKKLQPSVAVYVNGEKIKSAAYSVTYKNNKNVGTASVTVKGKGAYKGLSAKATFEIRPKAAVLSSPKSSAKKKISVKWKKVSQVSGYQVQYALNKKFTKGKKIKKVSGSGKTSVILTGLKSRKIYYIRIRTYKKVKGKTYYSSWSNAKKAQVK